MRLNIYAVGDIMLGEHHLSYTFGVKRVIENKGVNYLIKDVRDIFRNGDIVFGNLEAPISVATSASEPKANFFRANPSVVEGLKYANFNVLSVANNHIMEHGTDAFLTTVKLLRENEIIPVGIKNKIEVIKKKGVKIAIIAYSFIEDFIDNCLYNKVSTEEKILNDIEKVKDIVDLIILSLHWGQEFVPFPSPKQIEIGRRLIDAGADIILGVHPHVIQSYEMYNGKPIIYSLGNFIFDQSYIKRTRKSIIAKIVIDMNTRKTIVNTIPIMLNCREYYPQINTEYHGNEILKCVDLVRRKIENKSLANYRSTIGNYSELARKYSMISKIDMRLHLLRNIPRYPIDHLIYLVKNYLQKTKRGSH